MNFSREKSVGLVDQAREMYECIFKVQSHMRGIKLVYVIKGVVERSAPKLSSISAKH